MKLDPELYAPKSSKDIGVTLLGLGGGGLLDAIFNIAPYAEPFVVAPLCGVLCLGLKRSFFDKSKPDDDSDQNKDE